MSVKMAMPSRGRRHFALMAIWIGLCAYVLASYWMHDLAWIDGEVYTVFFMKMTILTFPSGMLVVTIGEYIVIGLRGISLDFSLYLSGKSSVFLIWSVMTTSGFLQWFFVISKVCKLPGKLTSTGRRRPRSGS